MDNDLLGNLLANDLKAGTLEVRLSQSAAEVDEAQALRYRVFYEEMGATPSDEVRASQRDSDLMDQYCDHLLVLDHSAPEGHKVVGTYRLIRREAAQKNGTFYSSGEFDITPLLEYPGEILELGRSCIAPDYRTGLVMQILWKGLAAYMFRHDIKLMFGCASFHGTDPDDLALPLSYLYYHHLAPPALRAKALPDVYVDMKRMPYEAFDPDAAFDTTMKVDPRSGLNSLPPLIKGYLRAGCFVGDGAFIDHQFNTIDVCIIFKTDLLTDRYMRHYERQAKRESDKAEDC